MQEQYLPIPGADDMVDIRGSTGLARKKTQVHRSHWRFRRTSGNGALAVIMIGTGREMIHKIDRSGRILMSTVGVATYGWLVEGSAG